MEPSNTKVYENVARVSSNVALSVTGVAMFTTSAPILTGVCIGAAIVSSGISVYTNYVATHPRNKEEESKPQSYVPKAD